MGAPSQGQCPASQVNEGPCPENPNLLSEDAHRYANRNGAPLFSFLRTVVMMNLLRRAGFRSIHAGQQDLAHDISRMLALGTANARRPD